MNVPKPTRLRRGVSLIEVLIALAITAILLVSVAAAFDAGFDSYSQNQQIVDAMQGSRVLLHRLMTQTRRSSYLNVSADGRRVQVEPSNENYQYVYVYLAGDRKVYLTRMELTTLATEELGWVDNVIRFDIPPEQWRENPDRLTCSLTIQVGSNQATLNGSAVPRTTIDF